MQRGLWSGFSHRQVWAVWLREFLSTKKTELRNEEDADASVARQRAHTRSASLDCISFFVHPPSFCSYGDRVEHFRVLEGAGQYCVWDKSFCSLNRLVDFYRTHSIALEKVVCLKDLPSSPRLQARPGPNPYPNPYRSTSQESIPSARLPSPPSNPKPVLEVWQWMTSSCKQPC